MKIYKITEASEYLGVSINTLKTLANNDKIKSFKTSGGHRRFRQDDLDAYMGVEKEKQEKLSETARIHYALNAGREKMKPYHKIQTIWKREPKGDRRLIAGAWTLPEFEYLAGNKWEFTEKVDGTNIRIGWDGTNVSIRGRTDNAQIPPPLYERLRELFTPEKMDEHFQKREDDDTALDVTLFGEGYGAKIQKGGGNYKSDGQDFVLFDVNINEWWLQRESVDQIAANLCIDSVPILGAGTISDMIRFCVSGFKSEWGGFTAEGIVARPMVELKARNGSRIITKLKCRDFEREPLEPKEGKNEN